ncbi:MAG: thiamine diphosphokinase [Tateyamaria sp.]|jgi:thiamine pyrophosphokinase|nr:thiamine diphosphokinase [Tateyamaria sp.]
MNIGIIESAVPVTLLGGGTVYDGDMVEALALAPVCVAADSGARHALAADVDLAAVVGDFDSIGPDLERIPMSRQIHIDEQDSTDFDKALRHILAPVVLAVGFTGARFDHQLAALHVLAAYPERACVLVGESELTFLCPPQIELPVQAGDIVSLFPIAAVSGTSDGLKWEINDLQFDPMVKIGTSNTALGHVSLTMDGPAMLVMVPRARLAAITRALHLGPQAARWSARAAQCTDQPQA